MLGLGLTSAFAKQKKKGCLRWDEERGCGAGS